MAVTIPVRVHVTAKGGIEIRADRDFCQLIRKKEMVVKKEKNERKISEYNSGFQDVSTKTLAEAKIHYVYFGGEA
jgi:hypothetical protein